MITLILTKFVYFFKVKQSESCESQAQHLSTSFRYQTISIVFLVFRVITASGERKIKEEERAEKKKGDIVEGVP